MPAWASAPANGTYDCNSGTIQNSPSSPNFTIYEGSFSAGASCVGAVVIPSGTLSLADEAFRNATSVTSISIPASLASIGSLALYNTTALTAINVDVANTSFASVSGVLFNKAQTSLIRYPSAKPGTSYTAPSSVVALGDFSFTDATALTSISIPDSVSVLGAGSFARTGITSFHIPTSVTVIPDYAFQGTALTSITIPAGVTTINAFAFYENYSLQSASLPTSLRTIGTSAFSVPYWMWQYSSLATVNFPNGLETIGQDAFRGTKLTSVTLPGTVTTIGDAAFASSSELTSLTISPGSLLSMGLYTFSGTPLLASVTLPDNITTIGDGVFRNPVEANIQSRIASIRLPSNLTSIGSLAFEGQNALTSITIPAGVTSIGDGAFAGATALTSISFTGSIAPSIGYGAFLYISTPPAVTIPLTTTGVGSGAGWSGLNVTRPNGNVACGTGGTFTVTSHVVVSSTGDCSGAVEVPYGVTSIGYTAFWQRAITSVSIPKTVTIIDDHAFRQTAMTSVTIPSSVQSIGYLSFGTTFLTQLTFESGSNLTSIGNEAFQSSEFTSVTLPASVTSVSSRAFELNNNLATINFLGTIPAGWPWSAPAGVSVSGKVNCGTNGYFVIQQNVAIGRHDCTGAVVIPVGVTSIADQAFDASGDWGGVGLYGNYDNSTVPTNITSLVIPNTVTSIGDYAFRSLRATSLTIPNSVTSIGMHAFAGSSMSTLIIGNGLTSIRDWTFSAMTNLQNVTFGTGVTSIGDAAFASNVNLASVTIPDSVESIGSLAFASNAYPFTLNYCGNADLAGTGLPSAATNAATCVPGPPRSVSVTPGNGSATVAFSAGRAGGSAITNYKYSLDGTTYTTISPASTASPITVSGLTNGNSYTVRLKAVNANGDSAASAPITFYAGIPAFASAAIAGVTVPALGATPVTTVTAGNGYTGTVSWSGSPSTFGAGQYTATITLTANAGYTFGGVPANFFTVAGATSVTNAANSRVITAVFPALYVNAPGEPQQVVATRTSPTSATVSFVAPNSDGGSPILSYTAIAWPGETTSTLTQSGSGTFTFTGLDPAESYIFDVMATNQGGNSDSVYSSWVLGASYDPATGNGVVPCATDGNLTGAGFFTITNNVVTYATDCVGAVVIPQGVVTIGEEAFWNESQITNVSMASSVTTIEDYAFGRLYNMTSLTIGSGVTTIGVQAFDRAYDLTTLVIPDGVISIGTRAFRSLESLTSLTIGNGVTTIGENAFSWLANLTSLTIGNSVTSIGDSAFTGLESLTSVTLPASIDSIGNYAFEDNYSLASVSFIGNAPSSVGDSVFAGLPAGAEALVDNDATGFGTGATWNGLVLTRSSIQNQNQSQTVVSASPKKGPVFNFGPAVSTFGGFFALKGVNLGDIASVKVAGKSAKITKKDFGEIVVEVPVGTESNPDVFIEHVGGNIILQGFVNVVKPYVEKRTQKLTGLTGSAPSKSALAALQKSYLAGAPANVISCVATVASNVSAKGIALAKKIAQSTCQSMVEFSSFIDTVDVRVNKTGAAGTKTTLAVTFDKSSTSN